MRVSTFMFLMIVSVWTFPFRAEAAINAEAIVLALSFDEGEGEEAKDASPLGNIVFLVEDAKWDEGNLVGVCD